MEKGFPIPIGFTDKFNLSEYNSDLMTLFPDDLKWLWEAYCFTNREAMRTRIDSHRQENELIHKKTIDLLEEAHEKSLELCAEDGITPQESFDMSKQLYDEAAEKGRKLIPDVISFDEAYEQADGLLIKVLKEFLDSTRERRVKHAIYDDVGVRELFQEDLDQTMEKLKDFSRKLNQGE